MIGVAIGVAAVSTNRTASILNRGQFCFTPHGKVCDIPKDLLVLLAVAPQGSMVELMINFFMSMKISKTSSVGSRGAVSRSFAEIFSLFCEELPWAILDVDIWFPKLDDFQNAVSGV